MIKINIPNTDCKLGYSSAGWANLKLNSFMWINVWKLQESCWLLYWLITQRFPRGFSAYTVTTLTEKLSTMYCASDNGFHWLIGAHTYFVTLLFCSSACVDSIVREKWEKLKFTLIKTFMFTRVCNNCYWGNINVEYIIHLYLSKIKPTCLWDYWMEGQNEGRRRRKNLKSRRNGRREEEELKSSQVSRSQLEVIRTGYPTNTEVTYTTDPYQQRGAHIRHWRR